MNKNHRGRRGPRRLISRAGRSHERSRLICSNTAGMRRIPPHQRQTIEVVASASSHGCPLCPPATEPVTTIAQLAESKSSTFPSSRIVASLRLMLRFVQCHDYEFLANAPPTHFGRRADGRRHRRSLSADAGEVFTTRARGRVFRRAGRDVDRVRGG